MQTPQARKGDRVWETVTRVALEQTGSDTLRILGKFGLFAELGHRPLNAVMTCFDV